MEPTPDDLRALHFLAAHSAGEFDQMRRRTAQGAERRLRGGRPLGDPPFGFRRSQTGTWEVDDDHWPAVHDVFDLYLTTPSVKQLKERLARRRNVKLSETTLRRMLSNPIYIDGRVLQAFQGRTVETMRVHLHTPVSQSAYRAAQAQMARRSQ